jgi:hypothetical protein
MNIAEAKAIYQKYNCSFFSIYREEGSKCVEYLETHVPRELRRKWAMELFKKYLLVFEEDPSVFTNYFNVSSILGNHHDEEFLKMYVNTLKKLNLAPEMRLHVCDDILGMRNLNTRIGILDYAQDTKNKRLFDFLLDYVHGFLNCPIEIADDRKSRYETMKDIATEYDKIQARGL